MDKWQAQQTYWSSFGLTACDETTVPESAELPYITYEAVSGSLGGVMLVSANVRYRSTSWEAISQKVDEMEKNANRNIKIDGGYLKIRKPESNFAKRFDEPNDRLIRRYIINVEMEFLTE